MARLWCSAVEGAPVWTHTEPDSHPVAVALCQPPASSFLKTAQITHNYAFQTTDLRFRHFLVRIIRQMVGLHFYFSAAYFTNQTVLRPIHSWPKKKTKLYVERLMPHPFMHCVTFCVQTFDGLEIRVKMASFSP